MHSGHPPRRQPHIGGFFDAHQASWNADERALFADILEEQDVDIMAWAIGTAEAPERFVAGQLKGIVGLSLRIERLEGKRKMSQNRAEPDRAGAEAGLAASQDPRDREVAAAMRAMVERG